jgi:hypothetical protein
MLPRKLTDEDMAANQRAEESLKWQQLFVDEAMRDYESARDLQDERRRLWAGVRNALLIMAVCAIGIWFLWRHR